MRHMHSFHPTSLVCLALATGCFAKQAPVEVEEQTNVRQASEAPQLVERPTDDGLIQQEIDLNSDGAPDVINFYRERGESSRLLVRKVVDLNADTRPDVRTWFTENGEMEKEEMDGDFDGRADWIDHYQGGKRVLSEIDSNYDGVFDLWKEYESGKVREKQRDTDGDGAVDFWAYLDDDGNVIKVGRDIDGDGLMDLRED